MPSSAAPSTRSRRTLAPVASTAWRQRTVSPPDSAAVRAAGSSSRPATSTEPSKPPSRSVSAHALPAAPAPTTSTSTAVSATAVGPDEAPGDVLLQPRVEHHEHLVAGLDHRVRVGYEARPLAQHRDHQRDDLEPLLGQVEQVHEPVARHLVLDQAQDQVGGRDGGLDAQQLEVLEV